MPPARNASPTTTKRIGKIFFMANSFRAFGASMTPSCYLMV